MYLSQIKLQNFRIFEECVVNFLPGLNLLVGENDAGKTALVDSIKLVLGTLSNEWTKIEETDFHHNTLQFSIVCILKNLSPPEAASFLEWLSFDEKNNYFLKLTLRARKRDNGRPAYTIYAGADEDSGVIQGEAREKLRVTYLKPLRDAEFELTPKRNSRFSQILDSYHTFKNKIDHPLVEIMKKANEDVISYFGKDGDGAVIHKTINDDYLANFSLTHNPLTSKIDISGNRLKSVLEKLELSIINSKLNDNLGLGSNNLLFIAAEMLLLKKDNDYEGIKLALIEEIEAHLHPQSQLNLIDFLESESTRLGFQSIITTHSNSLASKISINNLILCKGGSAFSLHEDFTKLAAGDYEFLKRFLDATKANLFFANGVLMVEGDAENLFLPVFADCIGKSLFKYGVSIVNVSSTALLRYSRIFQRKDDTKIGIPVACIADRDIPPKEAGDFTYTLDAGKNKGQTRSLIDRKTEDEYTATQISEIESKISTKYDGGDVKVFFTKTWTLEYEIACSSLRAFLYKAVTHAKASDNLDKALTPEEVENLYQECETDILAWQTAKKGTAEIAVNIYAPLLRKQASKAVVAQIMATLLAKNKTNLNIDEIRKDIYLKYLVDAIDYVTANSTDEKAN